MTGALAIALARAPFVSLGLGNKDLRGAACRFG
jgi:hypothetical protein